MMALRIALLTVSAIVVFVALDVCFACFGFWRVHRTVTKKDWVGRDAPETSDTVVSTVAATRKGINIATKCYYRSRKDCLPRAITTVLLLRWQGVPASLKIGVKKYPFAGHAWVECNGIIIDDPASVARQYSALAEVSPS